MKIGNSSPLSMEEKAQLIAECVENFNLYLNRWPEPRAAEGAVVEWEGEGCFVRDIEGREFLDCLGGFGISVYESFESSAVAKSGKVPMPKPKEKMLGGHAILAVGYDDTQRRFIIRNSWGPDWGVKGYFTLPYEYVLDSNLADDFWTIRTVQ